MQNVNKESLEYVASHEAFLNRSAVNNLTSHPGHAGCMQRNFKMSLLFFYLSFFFI